MRAPIAKTASVWALHFQSLSSIQPSLCPPKPVEIRNRAFVSKMWTHRQFITSPKFLLRSSTNDSINLEGNEQAPPLPPPTEEEDELDNATTNATSAVSTESPLHKFQHIMSTLPLLPSPTNMQRRDGYGFIVWISVATAFLFVAVRLYAMRKAKQDRPGTVADLVRRGQLRSDRRGLSKPVVYDDPFNNPFVKVGKGNSTVEMCGKVYRLAPVTLTKEEQATHQKRRSQAYQWKRPTIFLKEGDSIPPDVDPDAVRWIPANHPFATTASDIDEDLAQNNVYQQHGVPFRIQAEHEALQRKLEALQNEQKLNRLGIDAGCAKEFERPFKLNPKSNDPLERGLLNNQKNQPGESKPAKSDGPPGRSSSSEEMRKP